LPDLKINVFFLRMVFRDSYTLKITATGIKNPIRLVLKKTGLTNKNNR
jgi:hypothetical protein